MELHEHSCCDMQRVYKGAWTQEEDAILTAYMEAHGNEGRSWKHIATDAGLRRCGKSCRFRWLHYLRPSIDRRSFSAQEVELICNLHRIIGNKWTEIAKFLPGRSDNSIKNFWNSYCKESYPSIQHQQQQFPPITTNLVTNNQQILQQDHSPSANYDFTYFTTDQFLTSQFINTLSINQHRNFQDFDSPSDLPPFPESIPSPIANTSLQEISVNLAYDYSGTSTCWIDPGYSNNLVLEQPQSYLESSFVFDLLGTQDRNHLIGNSFFDHISSDLNNVYTSNNPSEGYSGTNMMAQATDWDLHNFHGVINTCGADSNYSLDPYVPFSHHH